MSLWQCYVMLHLGWFMTSPQNHIEDTYVFGEVSTSLLGLIQSNFDILHPWVLSQPPLTSV